MRKIRKGDVVTMTEEHKRALLGNGSGGHVREFGNRFGIVEGFLDYHNVGDELMIEKIGPEVNVRYGNGLRYGYHPDHLEEAVSKPSENRDNPLYCEHANEAPNFCPCPYDCYCKPRTCAREGVTHTHASMRDPTYTASAGPTRVVLPKDPERARRAVEAWVTPADWKARYEELHDQFVAYEKAAKADAEEQDENWAKMRDQYREAKRECDAWAKRYSEVTEASAELVRECDRLRAERDDARDWVRNTAIPLAVSAGASASERAMRQAVSKWDAEK